MIQAWPRIVCGRSKSSIIPSAKAPPTGVPFCWLGPTPNCVAKSNHCSRVRLRSLPSLDVRTMTSMQSGTRLGPYQIESKLGEGGMGEVFRGIDTRLGRPVAIKVVHQQFNARFER